MVVHTVHKGFRYQEYTDTHEERAPIIDGLGRAPPRPRAAGHLIIGASLSEPHIDEFAVEFLYNYICIYYFTYVVP